MNKFVTIVAFLVFSGTAFADGDVWYNGSHTFGASVQSAGSSNFFLGGNNGAPVMFSGYSQTATGSSQIWGQVGLWANTYVPEGTKGTAQAGGDLQYSFSAGHFNGQPYSSMTHSVNVWSSSTGTGNAGANILFNGNSSSFIPPPVPVVPVVGVKGL